MSADQGPPTPPEPKTPMWLPALGAVLFLLVGGWWALRPSGAPASEDDATKTAGDQAAPKGDGGAPQLILQPPPSASIKPAMIPR